jgi:hypothetical protein
VQGNHAAHNTGERRGNLGVLSIRDMQLAAHQVTMHLGVERVVYLANRSRKRHDTPSGCNLIDCKSMRREPRTHLRQACLICAKLCAEFSWCEPLMIKR